jgi:site-specific recombinase XerD
MVYIPVDIDKAITRECRRRRYSEQTIKTYLNCVNVFLKHTGKTIDKVSKKDVRLFLEDMAEKGRAGSTMNVYHMAIRFLFQDVLKKRMWIDIKYSKVPEKFRRALSKEEIRKILSVIDNPKHKLMVEITYSAGLRASELLNLTVKDLNIGKGYGFVRKGKGRKDRVFVIADAVKDRVSQLIREERLSFDDYLFTSNRKYRYSLRSLQQIVKEAAKKAEIPDWKEISPHVLRHSFATHLIENDHSVTDVQASLGHKSPETSMIYVHSSGKMIGIKSPLDSL